MKLSISKTTITLILLSTIAVTLVALPIATAHTPAWIVPTWCYVSLTNPTIGVNQETVIVFWINAIPATAIGAYGDRWTFTVEVTKPDSSKETLGPFTSDPIGGGWVTYTPTQVGTYTIVAKMAEHTLTKPAEPRYLDWVNDTYLASASDPATLIVQEEAIQPWPEAPLPTQFWTRPINQASRNWHVLAGNWLAGAAQNNGPTTRFCYGTGPESAHIMWATQMWAGGIMDDRFGETGFQTGHYEGTDFVPPIILNGKIYYNVMSLPREGWYCLDLYTGETLFFHNSSGPVTGVSQSSSGSIPYERLNFGQILNVDNPNQHGGMPYLWSTSGPGSTWMMFDAYYGSYICSIANVSASGTNVYGKDGSILYYNIVGTGSNKRLTVWNATHAIWWRGTQQQYQAGDYSGFSSNSYWMWRPGLNETYDGSHGFSLNASIPDVQGSILAVREDQYVIGGTSGKNSPTGTVQGNLWALNLKPDSNGIITPTILWNITFTPPHTDVDSSKFARPLGIMSGPIVDPEDGVFIFNEGITRQWWAYSLETGQQLWGPTAPEQQMNYYGMNSNFYQGKLLTYGYGGVLMAYDIKTGNVLWNYTAAQVGFESPYGNYPTGITAIADGKIYLITGEHSVTQPMWRGFLRCVNASDGAELWKILHFGADGGASLGGQYVVMADGYVVGLDQYDSKIYCYGKGPSAVTVTIQDDVVTDGDSVLVKGTVTDEAPGAKKFAETLGFVNGIPAISDEDQEAWMEYLYKQQVMPTNAKGVEVTLDTLDPNGNFVHIGTVTSDLTGTFGYAFTPEVPGTYQIIATFAGSASYYSSFAQTYIQVDEAPPATAPPEYPQPIDNTWTIIGVGIAIILVVIIVAILLLRKK